MGVLKQKWDCKGILKAHRSPTNRRYYTHEQYLEYRGLKARDQGLTIVYALVSEMTPQGVGGTCMRSVGAAPS